MILVIFEVIIKEDCMEKYLALAAGLKEELAKAKGLIRSERFSSFANERKLLSLSVWENEQAVDEWRHQFRHRIKQRQGRESMFENYTISVAAPLRVYTDAERSQAPKDSNEFFAL